MLPQGERTVQPVPYLQMRGIAILWDGKRLENYKQKMKTGIYALDPEEVNFVQDDSEDEEEAEVDNDYGMFEL
jgi:hypothetical protein